jgi:translation initiation factor 1 (eIF-1/SUI1)
LEEVSKMSGGKKKRVSDSGDLSLGGIKDFLLPIGDLVGEKAGTGKTLREEKVGDADEKRSEISGLDGFIVSVSQATLHRESSGRGGKLVVVIALKPAPEKKIADALAKAMRKGLGCGSHVEGANVVLQGDIRERAGVWLTKRGVRKVVMGN